VTENHPRWREAQRELEATLAAHPYRSEADELIDLVFSHNYNSARRTLAVADWLREYIAAREFGCTGLTVAPESPEPSLGGQDDRLESERLARRESFPPGF
jgi:hypothetical protein